MKWRNDHPSKPGGDYVVTNSGIGKIRMGLAYRTGSEWDVQEGTNSDIEKHDNIINENRNTKRRHQN